MAKTHYRKFSNSAYLASEDIEGTLDLTIDYVIEEKDKNNRSKKPIAVAYFKEKQLRPNEPMKGMFFNTTNQVTLRKHTGSKFIEDWVNIPVTVFVNSNVKNPMTGEPGGLGVIIRKPRQTIQPGTKAYDNAIKAFIRDGNFDAVLKRADISAEVQQKIRDEVSRRNSKQR